MGIIVFYRNQFLFQSSANLRQKRQKTKHCKAAKQLTDSPTLLADKPTAIK
ncbi:hypothetical protein HMPREF9151_01239 [Hoylesella saccharolytica F0055]|uniref:Uncharacterized protein n=1 Tax=Hoylesella saccharolytica F0055 TaxID=1127699 RepID=L1NB05_9BACT|nr:hypothetical protein HMPREF9151_01239 [Hoylesella saccharolytica F0055]